MDKLFAGINCSSGLKKKIPKKEVFRDSYRLF